MSWVRALWLLQHSWNDLHFWRWGIPRSWIAWGKLFLTRDGAGPRKGDLGAATCLSLVTYCWDRHGIRGRENARSTKGLGRKPSW